MRSYRKYVFVFMQITRYSGQILTELEYSQQIFKKNSQMSDFMKIRAVGAELIHAEG